ncbi:MAG: hypothetical protein M1830_010588 [Pleopsidium flavum]|nr:MAG: hypothetical protein M1830_010588 [Pleopsidium flavum]
MVYSIVAHLYTKPDATSIDKVKNKLIEAAQIYRKDKETIQWEVMQDVSDPRAFTVVERYEKESVCPDWYHVENPYWKTFNPFVDPLLAKPIDLRRYEDLDTTKEVKFVG